MQPQLHAIAGGPVLLKLFVQRCIAPWMVYRAQIHSLHRRCRNTQPSVGWWPRPSRLGFRVRQPCPRCLRIRPLQELPSQGKRLQARISFVVLKHRMLNTASSRARAANWYPRPDSNRHGLRLGILSPLCLPFHHAGKPLKGLFFHQKQSYTFTCFSRPYPTNLG